MLKQLAIVRNSLFALSCFMYVQNSVAQNIENNLYFVCGHPFENIEQQFDAWLLKYVPDSLKVIEVKQLSSNRQFLNFIKHYHTSEKILLLKDDWYSGINKYLTIISTRNQVTDTTIVLENFDYTYIDSKVVKIKDDNFLCLHLVNHQKSPKRIFIGINLKNYEQKELQADAFANSYVIGSTGGAIQSEDNFGVYTSKNKGELRIPKTSKEEDRPSFEITLPEESWNQDGGMKLILLNTNDLFVFKNKESRPSSKEVGNAELLIYHKNKNEWNTLKIKGNRSNVRSFGSMIAGVVQSYDVLVEKDSKGQQKVTKFKRISPGKEARRNEGTSTGAPVDERFFVASIYSPGVLYLYNAISKDYLEWNTGQGDSEILLVENNQVYYRVYDEIYKAQIMNGKKLGKAQLLIKNEIVPDIHWAFLVRN